jgi:hypothetical protein
MCELPNRNAVPGDWIVCFDSVENRLTRIRFSDPKDSEACKVACFCLLKQSVEQVQELNKKPPDQLTFDLVYEVAQRILNSGECNRMKLTDSSW